MLDRIERQWQAWAATPAARRKLDRWSARWPALGGWELAQLHAPRSSPATDAMQAALVALAQSGDQAASLTLLTQLRPGLLRLVRSLPCARSDPRLPEPDDVVAVACETIMLHRLDRRPRLIAANVLLDTRQRLSRAEAGRAIRWGRYLSRGLERRGHSADFDEPEVRIADLDLLHRLIAAIERSTADQRSRRLSAEVAYRAWFLDEPAPTIAVAVGLRPDAVRARLSRLRAAVRATEPVG